MQDFWASLNEGEEGYPALLGRPISRAEKYWLVQGWLRDLAVGREQFYAGKTVQREAWLVDCRRWDGRRWDDRCQGRLRVFSDGTADAWYPEVGLLGYDTEEAARGELGAAGFGRWEELKSWFSQVRRDSGSVIDPPAPPVSQADDPRGPFRYEGS